MLNFSLFLLQGNQKHKNKFLRLGFAIALFFFFSALGSGNVFAANLTVSPSSVSTKVGKTFTVDIIVNNNIEAINAVSALVSYPSDALSITSVSKTGSFISLWAEEPIFSNEKGTLSLEGVALNPGFSKATGKVISVTFKALQEGNVSISIKSGSVLANDGNATDVLKTTGAAFVYITGDTTPTVAAVKETGKIRGKDVAELATRIESYGKTINLIGARINQMSAYLKTRESVATKDERMKEFEGVLEFKHETLGDTLAYVKEIWAMTKNYVDSARDLFSRIQAKSTEASVKNLAIITSMGVAATLIGLFKQKFEFTISGVGYFVAIAVIGWLADKVMRRVAENRMYKIEEAQVAKDL